RPATEGWEVTDDASGFGNGTYAMMFNNYDIDLGGGTAEVWTAKYLPSTLSQANIAWDVAYVPYASNYQDSLEVLYSTDCGQNYTSVYLNGGSTMATGPANGSTAFIPTPSQWRRDSVNINIFSGVVEEILFVFRNIGNWGQRMYIDNINIELLPTVGIENNLSDKNVQLYPNPNNGHFSLELIDLEGNTTITVMDILGKVVNQQQIDASRQSFVEYELNEISKGTYLVKVENAKGNLVKKVVIE
ncbi:MAG: T9SS type A sorting domain-containing protein, partial [Bacteroidia bacterium]